MIDVPNLPVLSEHDAFFFTKVMLKPTLHITLIFFFSAFQIWSLEVFVLNVGYQESIAIKC